MDRNPSSSTRLTRFVPPMKAVSGVLPPDDGNWATELKWDGMRLQFHTRAASGPRLFSARGRLVTESFPELRPLADALGVDAVLDGEAVILDGGRPSFAHLQQRIHVADPGAELLERFPVFLLVFDLLELEGRSLAPLAYDDRRRLLEDLVADGPSWRVPAGSTGDPSHLLALAEERGLEGVVCKRRSSPYRPGGRSSDWIKVKLRSRQEFLVVGWLPSKTFDRGGIAEPRPDRHLGSLLLAVHDESGGLRFCGAVGSGLTEGYRTHLAARLRPGPMPFDAVPESLTGGSSPPPQWVEPTVVAEVEFSLWPDGGPLWHPVFCGIRVDREPVDIRRETPANPPATGPLD